jgi:hypothetical protein
MPLKDILEGLQKVVDLRKPTPSLPRPAGQVRRPNDYNRDLAAVRAETKWHCQHGTWSTMKHHEVLCTLPGAWYSEHPLATGECMNIKYHDEMEALVKDAVWCTGCYRWVSTLALAPHRRICVSCNTRNVI